MGCMAAMVTFAACNDTPSVEGAWVEPVPGMEGMTQGVKLEAEGKASSINMATLKYESWSQEGDRLILTGKSIGNGQTIDFADTLTIVSATADSLVLERKDGVKISYGKQQ